MKIQIGEVYLDRVTQQKTIRPNKTKKYLLPCLREYGDKLMLHLNNVFKIAVGIGDIVVDNSNITYEKHIFILIDTSIATTFFLKLLDWIRQQEHIYEDDYVYDNIQKSKYHMLVLKFPEKYYESFNTFREGQYSKMFDKENIDKLFITYPDIKKVFIKDHNYKVVFTERVNEKYGLEAEHKIRPEEWEGELEFPPDDKGEKFNHHLRKK